VLGDISYLAALGDMSCQVDELGGISCTFDVLDGISCIVDALGSLLRQYM